jgi:hypothetical protein
MRADATRETEFRCGSRRVPEAVARKGRRPRLTAPIGKKGERENQQERSDTLDMSRVGN